MCKSPVPPVQDVLCALVGDKGSVRHDFTATGPHGLWLADITEHWTGEGKLYVCGIKDVYSNRNRWLIDRLTDEVLARCCRAAPRRRARFRWSWSQFRSRRFDHAPNRHAMVGSMGRVAAAGDTAAMASFFSLSQKKVLDRRLGRTCRSRSSDRSRGSAPEAGALGTIDPIAYGLIMTTPATQTSLPSTARPSPVRAAGPHVASSALRSTRESDPSALDWLAPQVRGGTARSHRGWRPRRRQTAQKSEQPGRSDR